jgi:hypothetical protein
MIDPEENIIVIFRKFAAGSWKISSDEININGGLISTNITL